MYILFHKYMINGHLIFDISSEMKSNYFNLRPATDFSGHRTTQV